MIYDLLLALTALTVGGAIGVGASLVVVKLFLDWEDRRHGG